MSEKKFGVLQYTPRGFMQDAQDAIRGDLMRALIELITNADDAYDTKGGLIEIHLRETVAPFKWLVSVHDHATGLNASRMEEAFTHLGDENLKAAQDSGTRGLFGRGAKDVSSMGKARFLSVRNGLFSSLEINPRAANWSMAEQDDVPSSGQLRELRLEEGESGLCAELYIESQHRIPSPVDMVKKLQANVQLRDLLNRNVVTYFDDRANVDVQLHGIAPMGKIVLDIEIPVAKFGQKVRLQLFKHEKKFAGAVDEYSAHGLIISGKGAAYENSFLHLTQRPEAGWFSGRLDAPEIHDLARAIDKEEGAADPLNPTRIVSRQRDGLVASHPYYRALSAALDPHLKPHFDQMADSEGAERKEGAHLRQRFAALSTVLGKALQEILDEVEGGDVPSDSDVNQVAQGLAFIPPRRILAIDENVTVTLRAPLEMEVSVLDVGIDQVNQVARLALEPISSWRDHDRLPVKDVSVRFTAIGSGVAELFAQIGNQRATCQVIASIAVSREVEIPTTLEFETDKASVAPTRRRKLLLRAPIELAGEKVVIRASSELATLPTMVLLRPTPSGTHCEAFVIAQAGSAEGEIAITANVEELQTDCELEIKESGQGKTPQIKIEVVGNENPPRRVDLIPEDGKLIVRIYGRHRSLQKIFGRWTDAGFQYEGTASAGATVGEVVAQHLSIYAVEREAVSHPERLTDASSIFVRQQELMPRFILALQAGLLDIE